MVAKWFRHRHASHAVLVEAWHVGEILDSFDRDWDALPRVVADAFEAGVLAAPRHEGLTVKRQCGHMTAVRTDWLIRDVYGEFYACKPDLFEAAYEPVGTT